MILHRNAEKNFNTLKNVLKNLTVKMAKMLLS